MKRTTKRYLSLFFSLLLCFLTACNHPSDPPAEKTIEKPAVHYRIGICQSSTEGYDDQLMKGFQDALEKSIPNAQITVLTKNADNSETLASQSLELDRAGLDLLFLANTGSAIPLNNTNIQTPTIQTPTYDVTEQVGETLHQLLPDISQVGILYHSSSPSASAKAEKMMQYLDKNQISYKKYPATDITSFSSGANDICDQCDAAYIPADTLAVGQAAKLEDIFLPAGIPLISDHRDFFDTSMAIVTLDYYNLGQQLGTLAADVLQNGTAPDLSNIHAEDHLIHDYNRTLCEDFEIPLPDSTNH